MKRVTGAPTFLALGLLLLACGDGTPKDPRQERYDASLAAAKEAQEILRQGGKEAAREMLHRSYDHAWEALRQEGQPPRAEVLLHLAHVCLEISRWDRGYLGRAVRYAHHALREKPDWLNPRLTLGVAYRRAGLYTQAIHTLREYLVAHEALRDPPPDPGGRAALIGALIDEGVRRLKQLRLGCEGEVSQIFAEAWGLLPYASLNPDAHDMLTQMNRAHESEANAAIAKKDLLEQARVHARFGHFPPAVDALTLARNQLGRTVEVRWVEARYVEEMQGSEESLANAARHYQELIARGERVTHAVAGLARVLGRTGKGEEALERFGEYPEPSPELRRTLISLRLDRIRSATPEQGEQADQEFEKIQELFTGGLDLEDRAILLLEMGTAALGREDKVRVAKAIREFSSRFRGDDRILILEAGLQELSGEPLDPRQAGEKDG